MVLPSICKKPNASSFVALNFEVDQIEMSSALKRPRGGQQPYRLPLLLTVLCSLILPMQLCTSEGVSIDRYRQSYRRRNSVYYDDPSGIEEIFNEPLYIKANASVEVYPPKNMAVIGIILFTSCLSKVAMWLC